METLSPNQNAEEELTRVLGLVPKELAETWRKKTDEMDNLEEAISLVKEFVANRIVAKEKIFTSIYDIENPSLRGEVRAAIRSVEESFNKPDLFVGNGSVAEVYSLPEAPHVCVKYLVNPNMAREHGNNFREEAGYLNDMHGFVVGGIRVPSLLFYHSSDFGTCFGMEKIDGKSINIITESPDSIEYLDVIKKQNMNDVLADMRKFIKVMHEEKKIVHRDLTARNIMVDKNGNWFVIDFGRAKRIEIGDESTAVSEDADVPTAEGAIRALFKKIS
jgi:tRNA A-37 threonylcarbamoyl transferase component Bud32